MRALRDLFRPRCWQHTREAGKPRWLPWFSRFVWLRNLHPWMGGDEWCRHNLVVPLIFTSLVVPLWGCRDPRCEACEIDCYPVACMAWADAGVEVQEECPICGHLGLHHYMLDGCYACMNERSTAPLNGGSDTESDSALPHNAP